MKGDYILVIDDSETNNLLLQVTLEAEGFSVETASSSREGWIMIHHKRPKLILLDLLMPKVSGFQLLNKIKQKPEFSDIPVIIVSAVNEHETIKSLLKMGAADFFGKPLNLASLVKRIKEFN